MFGNKRREEKEHRSYGKMLALTCLNHISLVCRSLKKTLDFYQDVLGFVPIRRPESFGFDGAWLIGFGIGIHLLQSQDHEDVAEVQKKIDPKDRHISFQCDSLAVAEKKMGIKYVRQQFQEGGVNVEQLFFHDPDGFMIELCNCNEIPVIPLEEIQRAK